MDLEDYPDREGMKVWLSEREVQRPLDYYDDTEKRLALGLGARGAASGPTRW